MKNREKLKSYNPDQLYLLFPDMKDWLAEGDLTYFIIGVVGSSELGEVYASYDGSTGGGPPCDLIRNY